MKFPTFVVVSLLSCLPLLSQTEKIPLWDGPAPGTKDRKNTEVVSESGNISQVFQPELWYFPAPNKAQPAPALLVCPGGGYRNIVMPKEGVRVAEWFNKRGFAVFVLKYRLDQTEAVQDARRAMRFMRKNAVKYGLDSTKIGVTGFSAGGHLSANLALNYAESDSTDETDKVSARPDFCAPIYGVFNRLSRSKITSATPPMFLAHAVDDKTVPVEQSMDFFVALKEKGVPAELHLYELCGHGFALDPQRGYATSWGEALILWLKAHSIEGAPAVQP